MMPGDLDMSSRIRTLIASGAFHTPFLIAASHLARLRREVTVSTALGQARIEQDVAAARRKFSVV